MFVVGSLARTRASREGREYFILFLDRYNTGYIVCLEMSQILRVIKTEIISRFYGSQRNLRSHYETLRVPPDASQRDIRLAFIKLSKQMHPDLSKKTNHTDFVKINEAYNVLSKERTRQQYDVDLKFRGGSDGRPIRVVYYESEPIPRRAPRMRDPNDPSQQCYYGIKGLKHVSNVTIAFLCLLLSAFGLSIQLIVVRKSVATGRDVADLNEEGFKSQLKSQVSSLDRDQKIAAVEQRLATKDLEVEYRSLRD